MNDIGRTELWPQETPLGLQRSRHGEKTCPVFVRKFLEEALRECPNLEAQLRRGQWDSRRIGLHFIQKALEFRQQCPANKSFILLGGRRATNQGEPAVLLDRLEV